MFWLFGKRKEQELEGEIKFIKDEIGRSKRLGLQFCVLAVEVSHSVPRGLSKVMPGKTLSFHILERHLRLYDKIIEPKQQRRYYVVLPQTDRNGLDVVMQRIYELSKEHNWGEVLIGAAIYPEDGETPKALLDKAILECSLEK
jgi:hypothetical protein